MVGSPPVIGGHAERTRRDVTATSYGGGHHHHQNGPCRRRRQRHRAGRGRAAGARTACRSSSPAGARSPDRGGQGDRGASRRPGSTIWSATCRPGSAEAGAGRRRAAVRRGRRARAQRRRAAARPDPRVDDAAWRDGLRAARARARCGWPGWRCRRWPSAGFGRVIAVTSTAVRQPQPDLAALGGAALGAHQRGQPAGPRVRADGVTVNCVAPGATATAAGGRSWRAGPRAASVASPSWTRPTPPTSRPGARPTRTRSPPRSPSWPPRPPATSTAPS